MNPAQFTQLLDAAKKDDVAYSQVMGRANDVQLGFVSDAPSSSAPGTGPTILKTVRAISQQFAVRWAQSYEEVPEGEIRGLVATIVAETQSALRAMGSASAVSNMVVAAAGRSRVYYYLVGDSFIVMLRRGGGTPCLAHLGATKVWNGREPITAANASTALTVELNTRKYLGGEPIVAPTAGEIPMLELERDEWVLLASDGLTEHLQPSAEHQARSAGPILQAYSESAAPEDLCQRLRTGLPPKLRDDISVVILAPEVHSLADTLKEIVARRAEAVASIESLHGEAVKALTDELDKSRNASRSDAQSILTGLERRRDEALSRIQSEGSQLLRELQGLVTEARQIRKDLGAGLDSRIHAATDETRRTAAELKDVQSKLSSLQRRMDQPAERSDGLEQVRKEVKLLGQRLDGIAERIAPESSESRTAHADPVQSGARHDSTHPEGDPSLVAGKRNGRNDRVAGTAAGDPRGQGRRSVNVLWILVPLLLVVAIGVAIRLATDLEGNRPGDQQPGKAGLEQTTPIAEAAPKAVRGYGTIVVATERRGFENLVTGSVRETTIDGRTLFGGPLLPTIAGSDWVKSACGKKPKQYAGEFVILALNEHGSAGVAERRDPEAKCLGTMGNWLKTLPSGLRLEAESPIVSNPGWSNEVRSLTPDEQRTLENLHLLEFATDIASADAARPGDRDGK